MLRKLIATILIVFSFALHAETQTSTGADTLILGKPGSGNPTKIKGRDSGYLKKEFNGNWVYSNDGILEKKIGSGSGAGGSSGIMLNENDSFEDGLTPGWTSSGGTLTQETYANSSTDDTKYAQFVATVAGQYFETTAKAIPTNFSAGCQADIKKVNTTAANLFKIDVIDGSANILATANIGLLNWQNIPTLSFLCPSSGSTVKLRVTSLAAGTILADRGYVGSNQNLVYTSQAKLIGTMTVTGCAGGWTTSSTSLAAFPTQTGCSFSVTGSLIAPLTQIPAFRISRLEAGDYWIEYSGSFNQSTAGKSGWLRFTDGTNLARETSPVFNGGGTISVPGVSQSISYGSAQSNVTMELRGYSETGGSTSVYGVTTTPGVFKLWYFPASSDVAVNNEQSSWFIDANMGGANVGLGTSAMTSYNELQSASIDLVLNTAKGSASAEIACASGNASIGLTCSSAESFGVAFVPPWAGLYEVCAAFSQSQADGQDIVYQLAETSNTSATIIQEGGMRQAGNGPTGNLIPYYNCGTFNFSDISKRTIRLMYEKTATTANPTIIADRAAGSGQRDIKWTVRPLLSAFNRPILTGDQVVQPGVSSPKIKTAKYSAGSCSNIVGIGESWITPNSGTNLGTQCAWNMTGFTVAPVCFALPQAANAIANKGGNATTASLLQIRTLDAAGLTSQDTATDITCIGY